MVEDFRKPFTAPPSIFGVAFLVGLAVGLVDPHPQLSLWLQLLLGAICIISGVLLIRSSMTSFSVAETTYDPFAPSTALVTSGIYGHTRNPGYLGLAVLQFGLAFALDSPWIAVTAIAAITITDQFVIKLEEEKLTKTFGHKYEDYLSTVRRWI
jgi:protein-S-isoprenylcysteine O-methyltransferase Ste14